MTMVVLGDVPFLRSAVAAYRVELREIISAIQQQAQHAGMRPDQYIPREFTEEDRLIDQCFRAFELSTEAQYQFFGIDMSNASLAIINSAIALHREDLSSQLRALEADPLSPPAATAPLRDRLTMIDSEAQRFWSQYGESPCLPEVRHRRALKLGLAYPRRVDLEAVRQDGEGQELEFKSEFPSNTRDLGKEIAAFATSNPGTIFLGVSDDGEIVGLEKMGTTKARDLLQSRIEGLTSNTIVPSLTIRIEFETYRSQRQTHQVVRLRPGQSCGST